MAELSVPKGVIDFDDINLEKSGSQRTRYGQSKAANILLASEFAKRDSSGGVLNLASQHLFNRNNGWLHLYLTSPSHRH